jgi:hypothetical protein
MDAGTLIHVVAILEKELQHTTAIKHKEMGFTGKDPNQRVEIEGTTVATRASIELEIVDEVLTRLIDHFQSGIEAMLNSEEIARGM